MAEGMSDGLELDIEVRPAGELAGRLIVLASVCRRSLLETLTPEDIDQDSEDDEGDDAATSRYDLWAWLVEEGLDAAAEAFELDLIDAPVGSVDPEMLAAATWEGESLAALAWVAGLMPDPLSYDEQIDLTPVLSAIPEPWDKTAEFAGALRPVDDETAAAERERAELWFWRAGVEGVIRESSRREAAELRALVRETADEALTAGLLDRLADGDFAIRRTPVRDLALEDVDTLEAISERRLRALNWACGFGESWAAVPLDLD